MNLRDAFDRWAELDDHGVESWELLAFVRKVAPEPDDTFPYDQFPVIDLVIEDAERHIDFVIGSSPSTGDEGIPFSVGEARDTLRDLLAKCGDFELYVRDSSPEDDLGYAIAVDSPVVGVAANRNVGAFAFIGWFEGVDELGLFPE